jgi:glycosyltransferase involved in cell wall biosynthesis
MTRVAHIQRKPVDGHFSIEGLFSTLRAALPQAVVAEEIVVPEISKGIGNRIRNTRFCRRIDHDVLHVTGDIHYVAMGLPKDRSILTIHDCEILDRLSGLKRWILKRYWYVLPVRSVACVTTISETSKKEILKYTGISEDRVSVIPNPVSPRYQAAPKNFNQKQPRILQIGTKENKNILRLIEALKGLFCHLRIIGKLTGSQIDSPSRFRHRVFRSFRSHGIGDGE